MKSRRAVVFVMGLVLFAASEARAQEERAAARTSIGVLVGGFDYYFGSGSFYPHLSGRFQQRIDDVIALEASLTAVAAGEGQGCPDGAACGGEAFSPLLYPAVGVQLRLPTGRVSPYVGGSIGVLVGGHMARSLSLELGLVGRLSGARDLVIEVRRRFDDRFEIIETTATEVGIGLYWRSSVARPRDAKHRRFMDP